jgi:hypothetical protein
LFSFSEEEEEEEEEGNTTTSTSHSNARLSANSSSFRGRLGIRKIGALDSSPPKRMQEFPEASESQGS